MKRARVSSSIVVVVDDLLPVGRFAAELSLSPVPTRMRLVARVIPGLVVNTGSGSRPHPFPTRFPRSFLRSPSRDPPSRPISFLLALSLVHGINTPKYLWILASVYIGVLPWRVYYQPESEPPHRLPRSNSYPDKSFVFLLFSPARARR